MAPLLGVFAAATVAGFGATLGYRVARDVVMPLAERGADGMKDWWGALHRRDGTDADDTAEEHGQPDLNDS